MSWQVTCELIRALARGPSGTLMQSMPCAAHSLAPAISLEASTPRGGRISTNATNFPAASLAPSCDFSAMGTFGMACALALGSSTVTPSFFCTGCSERASAQSRAGPSGVCDRGGRRGGAAQRGYRQSEPGDRRGRAFRGKDLDPERIPHAALPHGRDRGCGRRGAAEIPLRRSAPPAHAAQHHPALEDLLRRARMPLRYGFPRNRDAFHDPLHAGRRARLPGAQPRAAGQFLCAAAIAANLQATADGLRLRKILPDRELIKR